MQARRRGSNGGGGGVWVSVIDINESFCFYQVTESHVQKVISDLDYSQVTQVGVILVKLIPLIFLFQMVAFLEA